MAIISKSQLTQIRLNESSRRSFSWINDSVNAKSRLKKASEVSIFLSHKHDEEKELTDAIVFLNSQNVDVYVDWLDKGMPNTTSGATAIRIKAKIKEKRKFIFLATEKAIASKWCNWELGIGDVLKYIDHIALLPLKNDDSSYSGNEYLLTYPYIYMSDSQSNSYYVKFPKDSAKSIISLSSWLTS